MRAHNSWDTTNDVDCDDDEYCYDDDENADDGVDNGDYGVGGDVIPDNDIGRSQTE